MTRRHLTISLHYVEEITNVIAIHIVDGRIILRWIFRKWEGVVVIGWSSIRIGTGGGHL